MESARCLIEVTASVMPPEVQMTAKCGSADFHQAHALEEFIAIQEGLLTEEQVCLGIPTTVTGWQRNRPEQPFTKQWALTSAEWQSWPNDHQQRLQEWAAPALAYATELLTQPDRFNHVRVDWIWL